MDCAPKGACGNTLVVTASGSWVLLAQGKSTNGTLSHAQLADLVSAVRATQLDRATGVPDCAANRDGTSVAYVWILAGVRGSASSCEHPIDLDDPLTVEIEKVAHAVIP